jgi:predicted  nucleic acid-binding Zn-ribbon protein
MDDEAKSYSLPDASRLTGLSVDALRKRIERQGRRSSLRGARSNEDGQWHVWLTDRDIDRLRSRTARDGLGLSEDGPPDESRTINALEGELGTVREALARERERADRSEARAEELREQREAARTEADRLRAELEEARIAAWEGAATLREEREEARIRAARLEGELEALRRPWWKRLIGQ